MTQQFDEGVKEVLMTLLSLGATAYETDYVLKQLEKRPEPVEQIVQAVEIADRKIDDNKFDKVAQEVIAALTEEEPDQKSVLVKGKLDRPSYIYNRLIEGGLTPVAAVGIVANLKAESNLDPTTKQYGGGPGRGLAQWERGGRFDTDRINLVKFAKRRGTSWTDLDTQIDFILHEMDVHPEYKRVKRDINKVDSVEEAALLFLKRYEKAGIPHTSKRLGYAEELASLFL